MKPVSLLRLPCLLALGLALLATACKPRSAPASDEARVIAEKINADFHAVNVAVVQLARSIADVYPRGAVIAASVDTSRYTFAPNGAFYKIVNDGKTALWVSAATPITPEVMQVAYFTEAIEPELIRSCRDVPVVCQSYYNDRHSVNRIYPWIDTLAQYPPRMNIPDYNFYYLADAEHNPSKGCAWLNEPYVDPAGRGWMVSAIAPVYVDGRLEGVCGLDVTIATLVERFFKNTGRSLVIISKEGVLVAATETAILELEMPPIKNHKYLETVKLDTFKPDEYNIRKSTLRPVRALAARLLDGPPADIPVELAGKPRLARSARVGELDWFVVEFIDGPSALP